MNGSCKKLNLLGRSPKSNWKRWIASHLDYNDIVVLLDLYPRCRIGQTKTYYHKLDSIEVTVWWQWTLPHVFVCIRFDRRLVVLAYQIVAEVKVQWYVILQAFPPSLTRHECRRAWIVQMSTELLYICSLSKLSTKIPDCWFLSKK